MNTFSHRRALSLFELLVVLAIIGVLVSIALVTINAVRAQARQTACQNKLRQLGLAMQSFESANGFLPHGAWQKDLLPFLELNNTIESLSKGKLDAGLAIFRCPDDGETAATQDFFGNYLACVGVWKREDGFDGAIDPTSTPYNNISPITTAEITGGLSNTSFAAEALIEGDSNSVRLRAVWSTPGIEYSHSELDEFVDAALSIPKDPEANGWGRAGVQKGKLFVTTSTGNYAPFVGVGFNLYNHAAPPQSPSCTNSNNIHSGLSSATSNHSQEVNLVYCDGHVGSVGYQIDIKVWREFGSRN